MLVVECVAVGLGSMSCMKLLLGKYVGGLEGGNHRSLWGFVRVITCKGTKLLCTVF